MKDNKVVKTLTSLIDDVLDFSRSESGTLETESVSFEIDELVLDVMNLFQESARAKGVSLKATFSPETPRVLTSDPARLRQILLNIVGNAVKFTPTGTVQIKVDPVLLANRKFGIQFSIIDSGIGMSDEDAFRLFEPFSQVDTSSTRKFSGAGLGLALARRIARALGGDVEVICGKNKGCSFFVTIEAVHRMESSALKTIANNLNALKILFVEDSVDNQDFVKHALELQGAIVECADNGEEGVYKAGHEGYDLILMDMQMPVLDGYSATQQLRAGGFEKPIIALTAHAMVGHYKQSMAAGCNAHLTKPIDMNLLVRTIKEATQY